ncbi:acetyltransferase [Vibrio cholerae]|uniref:Acetyltransferase n=1 Tax=Vibrio cholerae TaxID=666 RepID=A0A544BSK2_VIBCL|nr:acetyltransferase [Vibrio cholerae]
MVTVVAFEFSVMRCQPLRRALAVKSILPVTLLEDL